MDLDKEKIVLLFKTFRNLEEIRKVYGDDLLRKVLDAVGGFYGLVGTVYPEKVDREEFKEYQQEQNQKGGVQNPPKEEEYGIVQQILKEAEERHNIPLEERINAIDSEKLNIPSASPIQEEKQGIEMVREEPSSTLDPRQANIYRSGAEEPVNDDLLNHPVDKPDVMDSSIEIAENETGQIMEETRPKTRVLAPPHNTAPSIPEEARPIENPAKPGKVQWDIDKVTTPGEWNDDNQEKVL